MVNAGGIINIAEEFVGYDPARAEGRVRRVFDTTLRVLQRAQSDGVSPARAADRVAEDRIASVAPLRAVYTQGERTAWNHAPDGLLRRRR